MTRLLFAISFVFVSTALWASQIPIPVLESRVTDQTNTLTASEIANLEAKLKQVEDSTGSQIVVLLIPTTGDESIEAFSMRLAEEWKIGQSGNDNGIILLVAKDDRNLRIEVGYGFEGALPDAMAARIIDELITPEFKNGDFAAGINAGTDALVRIAYGEEFELPANTSDSGSGAKTIGLAFLFFTLLILAIILIARYKFKAVSVIAVVVFILSLVLDGWETALGAIFFIFIFGSMIVGFFSGGGSSGSYSSGSSYSSSSSSSWSSSGSSFSGGGGSFGGGGASGSW